ncbi:response regulator [Dyadobacter frigoris]|uniref:histidine kinase n=1 Tax=Dyadobacter frigoris TaxID=2576211 RepID=A0A4U6CTT8_9BACT|nr:response regulator [Dyadobacter frigoris]TKT88079.1 response regulator [Dyadobacter frigoris]GLU53689.1 hypothetical protein Dfri01_31500 [Dyadobacter frigoris]
MRIRTLLYYIITGFIIGTITLVLVQYITSNNVKELISSNENLLQEYKVSNELVRLQKDLLLLDNKTKTAVITGDSTQIKDFKLGIIKVREDLDNLKKTDGEIASLKYMQELDALINQKIVFSHQMVDSFYRAGRPASENILATDHGLKLSETITNLTHKIDTSGRIALAQKIKYVDKSGQRVLDWNYYIILLVLFLFTAVFLIIVNRMKKQAELINQLNTSEKKLKEAAQIKENFLANMSHEIRTPLNAILGYTHLLQRKNLDKETMLHVCTVHKSGETLLSIVNDILDLSKIESGMMRIEMAPFNIRAVIHAVTAMFHHKIEEKNLELFISIATDIPETLSGDATRLTQILVNLLGNAVKFTSKGSISLDIYKKTESSEAILIGFRISDTGIGIETEKLETIFERFRQAEDSTTRKYGGTGLGLSIVRDLVYLQHGNIDVESSSGKGTKVSFSISYRKPAGQNKNTISENNVILPNFKPDLKILIVEDNEINQGLMSRFLQEWNMHYSIAGNGKKAIELIENEYFDLVFMDIQMPEMDGYSAAHHIRQKLELDIPIVAMTANAMAGEREKCMALGMNDYLSKPVRESALIDMINRYSDSIFSIRSFKKEKSDLENDFLVINLHYMKEISKGDRDYEKLVTEQFITLLPKELSALSEAFTNQDNENLKRIGHNMKTSISIMGLDNLLSENLDIIESENPDKETLATSVTNVIRIGNEAILEANQFYLTL